MAEQTILCTGDTFISRYSGNDNNYSSAELAMWREINSSSFMGTFVQFNLPAFDNKEIVSAVIRLHNKIKVKNSIIGCAQYNIPDIWLGPDCFEPIAPFLCSEALLRIFLSGLGYIQSLSLIYQVRILH